jgi:hypothetical protein
MVWCLIGVGRGVREFCPKPLIYDAILALICDFTPMRQDSRFQRRASHKTRINVSDRKDSA